MVQAANCLMTSGADGDLTACAGESETRGIGGMRGGPYGRVGRVEAGVGRLERAGSRQKAKVRREYSLGAAADRAPAGALDPSAYSCV